VYVYIYIYIHIYIHIYIYTHIHIYIYYIYKIVIILYIMLYHTYYKGGEESHLTYYYFVVTCFVTGVSRTSTPYCGCSFAIVSFFVSIDSSITRHACTSCICVHVCTDRCMYVSCVHGCDVASRCFARLLLFLSLIALLFVTRDRSGSSKLLDFSVIYADQISSPERVRKVISATSGSARIARR